ncbi:MAG TPA: PAS domain S-box protein, partial [Puia sp.]|nr:PAS domain S-box protein [Puia sp.]
MKRQPQTDSLTISHLKRWSIYFSGVVFTVGAILIIVSLLVLAGWQWDIGWLKNPWPDLTVINPVTAIGFLLSGFSLLIFTPRRRSRRHTAGGLILASLVFAIGLLRLLSVWWPAFWRVDYLLYSEGIIRDALSHHTSPLVMVPETAIAFLLAGLALLLLPVRGGYGAILHQVPAIGLGFVAILTLVCYLYGVMDFNRSTVTMPMAAHSALCFLLLALALLFAAPGKGIMRQITGPYTGSVTARRFIPFALVVPVIMAWAVLFSPWRNAVSVQLSAEILVTGLILFSLTFIGYNTALLNRRDLANLRVRQALQASEERYGLLVGSIKDHAIVMLDPSGSLVSWNEGAQAITGYTAEEVIGHRNAMFYGQRDVDEGIPIYNLQQAAEHGQYQREGWRPRKDGTRYWAEVTFTAIRTDNGRLQGFAVIVRDSTERKQAQE